ncbi:MAG: dethiobiotin synthase [Chitinophagaceae bacterium]
MLTPPIFITGIGTGVGKTLVAAIVTEALQADYWKPVQAGYEDGTDSNWVKTVLSNPSSIVHPELYKFKMAVSPHIAAREENIRISISGITAAMETIQLVSQKRHAALVMEGAGGLLVPVNETEFVADLIKHLQAKVILVSRNYLGSINHSLLTAEVCRYYKLDVLGWIFNDQYLAYEEEIVHWSGFPKIGAIPFTGMPDKKFIRYEAPLIADALKKMV